jgi:hypothetical protein
MARDWHFASRGLRQSSLMKVKAEEARTFSFTINYYSNSKRTFMYFKRLIPAIGFAVLVNSGLGCAQSALTPLRVRAFDHTPWPPLAKDQPLIVDFKAGDRIPVTLRVDGEILATTPDPSTIWLTAKRDFSVRVRGSELRTSLDGAHFDDKPKTPGQFRLGLQTTREAGIQVVLRLTTPVHAKP